MSSRYIIGIDFGTTNSAVTYIDTNNHDSKIEQFQIPQYISTNETHLSDTFPSFLFFSATQKPQPLPNWDYLEAPFMGTFAREQTWKTPDRVIHSAKSWICHNQVDRHEAILPWHGNEDVEKISPIKACANLLSQIKTSWNIKFPDEPIEKQDVIITVPASFDQVARSLIAESISQISLKNVTLLEEPQAAFYAWLYHHPSDWSTLLDNLKNILVVDIGGGTSDFSLIRINENNSQIEFERHAVGDHLLLGGDNLDITIAHYLEPKFNSGAGLKPKEWGALIGQCRQAKEDILGPKQLKEVEVKIIFPGKSIVGNVQSVTITKEELENLLIPGFLPITNNNEKPDNSLTGFQEFGLPYAKDSAITKHLNQFLNEADINKEGSFGLLFNGGFFHASIFQERLLNAFKNWGYPTPTILQNPNLDTAVSIGASYYGLAQRGKVQKIKGGLSQTFLIGIRDHQQTMQALCLAPIGMAEGDRYEINQNTFHLRVNQPVEFPVFLSKTAVDLLPGQRISIKGLKPSVPIRSFLKAGKKNRNKIKHIDVYLKVEYSPLGMIEISCREVNGDRTWNLEFDTNYIDDDVNMNDEKAITNEISEEVLQKLQEETIATFAENSTPQKLDGYIKRLEAILEKNRWNWDLFILRQIWSLLMEIKDSRKKTAHHETRWLNACGFCLRPGYGVAMDDWRVQQSWNLYMEGIQFPKQSQNISEWFLFWNRISGGLSPLHQRELASAYIKAMKAEGNLQETNNTQVKNKRLQLGSNEKAQLWRLLANLEHLYPKEKREVIKYIERQIKKFGIQEANNTGLWALGRLATRTPLYGHLNNVLPAKYALETISFIEKSFPAEQALFSIEQICRITGDRYRDIEVQQIKQISNWLDQVISKNDFMKKLKEPAQLQDRNTIFGEKLPEGLRISHML